MARLSEGERAPEFSLPDDAGRRVSLAELRTQGPIVLYFYPKDDTLGCTIEACTFRDSYQDFKDAGATVVGVSEDGKSSHEAFKAKHALPFVLLSDPGGETAKAYGVKKTLGLLPGRVTFVIDREGVVRSAFDSQVRVKEHVAQALEVVKRLAR